MTRAPTTGVLQRTVAPDLALDPLTIDVLHEHLRVASGYAEDSYLARLIQTSYARAERVTRRALLTQTWTLTLSGFPSGAIVLARPPVQSVTGITYVDENGVTQSLVSSPADFETVIPEGPTAGYATIAPLYNETWPTTRTGILAAVIVTFLSGYPVVDGLCAVPDDITHGRLLMIGELYKQRSESVHAFNQNPALIRAEELWRAYRPGSL